MTATAPAAQAPTLWRHKGFRRLWGAQAVSVLGSQVTELALPLAAVAVLGAGAFEVGVLVAVQYLPFLLVGLPAGAWVDRLPRRPVMVIADVVRFGVLLALPVLALTGVLELWMLYPVAFVVGVATVFFDIAAQAYLPALIGEDRLIEGNTKLQVSQTVGQLAGPSVGGFLIQLLTAPVAVIANAIGFAVSGLLLLGTKAHDPRPERRPDAPGLVAEVREGLRYVFGHRLLRPLALTAGLGNLFGVFGMVQAVLVLFAVRDLGLEPGVLGLALAFANGGVLLGATVNGRLTRRWGTGPMLAASSLLLGACLLLLPLATRATAVPVLGVSMALAGVFAAIFNINQVSLRQAVTPAELRGRMTATMRFVVWGTIPVGTFAGGALAETVGVRPMLWIAGVGSVLAGLPVLLSAVRALREIPTSPDAREPADAPGTPDQRGAADGQGAGGD
ncbi:MFS transporter [Streptomyces sp. NPDC047928]|uniref:MFS transporter n=1 Tax=unclassified Streptomyces TaxID=2593676 RepID=UPI003719C707